MGKEKFNVAIMHGHSNDYKAVKELIVNEGYTPMILMEDFHGDIILKKLRKSVWKKAHCAVIVMSPDDEMKDAEMRARQNVVFELGYCMGAFDSIPSDYWYSAVIILKEESVKTFADIEGIEYIGYKNKIGKQVLDRLGKALAVTREKAKEYYDDL